jgi:hypothetical protein
MSIALQAIVTLGHRALIGQLQPFAAVHGRTLKRQLQS